MIGRGVPLATADNQISVLRAPREREKEREISFARDSFTCSMAVAILGYDVF